MLLKVEVDFPAILCYQLMLCSAIHYTMGWRLRQVPFPITRGNGKYLKFVRLLILIRNLHRDEVSFCKVIHYKYAGMYTDILGLSKCKCKRGFSPFPSFIASTLVGDRTGSSWIQLFTLLHDFLGEFTCENVILII